MRKIEYLNKITRSNIFKNILNAYTSDIFFYSWIKFGFGK